MTSTIGFFPTDFYQKIEASTTALLVTGTQAIVSALLAPLLPYLPWAIGFLFIVLVIASVKAMFGRTGMLGSLLYHIFYFGILGIVVWIMGVQILFNAYFDLICAVLYRLCYWLTGLILDKFKGR
jgi:hypothetical protein